uniref:Uncharacterized protein n=1 Tax=Lepeophtheirus salmonis TaxID=72036 RepID=A0A0K2V780_LEPSM
MTEENATLFSSFFKKHCH